MTQRGLPAGWRRLFQVELPLVLGTLGYWLLAPTGYLEGVLGITSPDPGVLHLLQLYAGSVGSLVFWAYARLLFSPEVHLPSFRVFQEGLLVGDIAVIVVSMQMFADAPEHLLAPVIAQLCMASAWGAVRVVFLARVRPSGIAEGA